MRINYNVSSIIAQNALNNNDNRLSISTQKLSSGYKITSAKDDAAGLAIARKMNMQIQALNRANQNSNDGLSVVDTADGAMTEIHSILQRMNELSVQAANGTNSDDDRGQIQLEIDQLVDEIDRIAETTQFNAQNLLDGTFAYKGYTNTDCVKVMSNTDDVLKGIYEINLSGEEIAKLVEQNKEAVQAAKDAEEDDTTTVNNANTTIENCAKKIQSALVTSATASASSEATALFSDDVTVTIDGDEILLKNDRGFEIKLDINDVTDSQSNDTTIINITKMGPMIVQTGANEGQQLEIEIPAVYAKNLGVNGLDVSTEDNATESINIVADAINQLSSIRSKIGAYANRLEHTVTNLNTTEETMTQSYSRIMDVDMAEETTEYTTMQVLVQAATSVLAQANERPEQVLQLLQ
jgi:flagellin